jgi:hypothetical protein
MHQQLLALLLVLLPALLGPGVSVSAAVTAHPSSPCCFTILNLRLCLCRCI